MRRELSVLTLLTACSGQPDDTGDGVEADTAESAIDEVASTDRVGTYAYAFPESPSTVIFLGDSITAGAGAQNDDESYAELLVNNTSTWPDWDGRDLATRYPGIDVVDVSEGGAQTGTVLNSQIEDFEAAVTLPFEGEALVIITAGGNDLYSVLRNPSGVEERVEKTVNNWREIAEYFLDDERFPDGSTVLMANVYEPTDAVGQYSGCFYGLKSHRCCPICTTPTRNCAAWPSRWASAHSICAGPFWDMASITTTPQPPTTTKRTPPSGWPTTASTPTRGVTTRFEPCFGGRLLGNR